MCSSYLLKLLQPCCSNNSFNKFSSCTVGVCISGEVSNVFLFLPTNSSPNMTCPVPRSDQTSIRLGLMTTYSGPNIKHTIFVVSLLQVFPIFITKFILPRRHSYAYQSSNRLIRQFGVGHQNILVHVSILLERV